ncbi:unnamed protein product [Soboliphyme baturini]|uniref:Uncharacterized protein n=1 Tax=Soboliphyme baturini TaxID=241478 RepID=A0A183IV43_9BILA|nr:unnamed protein product [Soboliphyme baturini]
MTIRRCKYWSKKLARSTKSTWTCARSGWKRVEISCAKFLMMRKSLPKK